MQDWGRLNVALLSKWRWCLLNERGSIWAKVIMMKYNRSNPSKGSICWQDLRKICFQEEGGVWFESNLRRRLRSGNEPEVLFREETWLNGWTAGP